MLYEGGARRLVLGLKHGDRHDLVPTLAGWAAMCAKDLIDDDTVVLIVSDHGFKASGSLPRATNNMDLRFFGIDKSEPLERPVNVGMTGVHRENGVLVAAGGPIRVGAEFEASNQSAYAERPAAVAVRR